MKRKITRTWDGSGYLFCGQDSISTSKPVFNELMNRTREIEEFELVIHNTAEAEDVFGD